MSATMIFSGGRISKSPEEKLKTFLYEIHQCDDATKEDIGNMIQEINKIKKELLFIKGLPETNLQKQKNVIRLKIKSYIHEIEKLNKKLNSKIRIVFDISNKIEEYSRKLISNLDGMESNEVVNCLKETRQNKRRFSKSPKKLKRHFQELIQPKERILAIKNHVQDVKNLLDETAIYLRSIETKTNSVFQTDKINNNHVSNTNNKMKKGVKLKEDCDKHRRVLSIDEEKKLILNQIRLKEEQRKQCKAVTEEKRRKQEILRLEERQRVSKLKFTYKEPPLNEFVEEFRSKKEISENITEPLRLLTPKSSSNQECKIITNNKEKCNELEIQSQSPIKSTEEIKLENGDKKDVETDLKKPNFITSPTEHGKKLQQSKLSNCCKPKPPKEDSTSLPVTEEIKDKIKSTASDEIIKETENVIVVKNDEPIQTTKMLIRPKLLSTALRNSKPGQRNKMRRLHPHDGINRWKKPTCILRNVNGDPKISNKADKVNSETEAVTDDITETNISRDNKLAKFNPKSSCCKTGTKIKKVITKSESEKNIESTNEKMIIHHDETINVNKTASISPQKRLSPDNKVLLNKLSSEIPKPNEVENKVSKASMIEGSQQQEIDQEKPTIGNDKIPKLNDKAISKSKNECKCKCMDRKTVKSRSQLVSPSIAIEKSTKEKHVSEPTDQDGKVFTGKKKTSNEMAKNTTQNDITTSMPNAKSERKHDRKQKCNICCKAIKIESYHDKKEKENTKTAETKIDEKTNAVQGTEHTIRSESIEIDRHILPSKIDSDIFKTSIDVKNEIETTNKDNVVACNTSDEDHENKLNVNKQMVRSKPMCCNICCKIIEIDGKNAGKPICADICCKDVKNKGGVTFKHDLTIPSQNIKTETKLKSENGIENKTTLKEKIDIDSSNDTEKVPKAQIKDDSKPICFNVCCKTIDSRQEIKSNENEKNKTDFKNDVDNLKNVTNKDDNKPACDSVCCKTIDSRQEIKSNENEDNTTDVDNLKKVTNIDGNKPLCGSVCCKTIDSRQEIKSNENEDNTFAVTNDVDNLKKVTNKDNNKPVCCSVCCKKLDTESKKNKDDNKPLCGSFCCKTIDSRQEIKSNENEDNTTAVTNDVDNLKKVTNKDNNKPACGSVCCKRFDTESKTKSVNIDTQVKNDTENMLNLKNRSRSKLECNSFCCKDIHIDKETDPSDIINKQSPNNEDNGNKSITKYDGNPVCCNVCCKNTKTKHENITIDDTCRIDIESQNRKSTVLKSNVKDGSKPVCCNVCYKEISIRKEVQSKDSKDNLIADVDNFIKVNDKTSGTLVCSDVFCKEIDSKSETAKENTMMDIQTRPENTNKQKPKRDNEPMCCTICFKDVKTNDRENGEVKREDKDCRKTYICETCCKSTLTERNRVTTSVGNKDNYENDTSKILDNENTRDNFKIRCKSSCTSDKRPKKTSNKISVLENTDNASVSKSEISLFTTETPSRPQKQNDLKTKVSSCCKNSEIDKNKSEAKGKEEVQTKVIYCKSKTKSLTSQLVDKSEDNSQIDFKTELRSSKKTTVEDLKSETVKSVDISSREIRNDSQEKHRKKPCLELKCCKTDLKKKIDKGNIAYENTGAKSTPVTKVDKTENVKSDKEFKDFNNTPSKIGFINKTKSPDKPLVTDFENNFKESKTLHSKCECKLCSRTQTIEASNTKDQNQIKQAKLLDVLTDEKVSKFKSDEREIKSKSMDVIQLNKTDIEEDTLLIRKKEKHEHHDGVCCRAIGTKSDVNDKNKIAIQNASVKTETISKSSTHEKDKYQTKEAGHKNRKVSEPTDNEKKALTFTKSSHQQSHEKEFKPKRGGVKSKSRTSTDDTDEFKKSAFCCKQTKVSNQNISKGDIQNEKSDKNNTSDDDTYIKIDKSFEFDNLEVKTDNHILMGENIDTVITDYSVPTSAEPIAPKPRADKGCCRNTEIKKSAKRSNRVNVRHMIDRNAKNDEIKLLEEIKAGEEARLQQDLKSDEIISNLKSEQWKKDQLVKNKLKQDLRLRQLEKERKDFKAKCEEERRLNEEMRQLAKSKFNIQLKRLDGRQFIHNNLSNSLDNMVNSFTWRSYKTINNLEINGNNAFSKKKHEKLFRCVSCPYKMFDYYERNDDIHSIISYQLDDAEVNNIHTNKQENNNVMRDNELNLCFKNRYKRITGEKNKSNKNYSNKFTADNIKIDKREKCNIGYKRLSKNSIKPENIIHEEDSDQDSSNQTDIEEIKADDNKIDKTKLTTKEPKVKKPCCGSPKAVKEITPTEFSKTNKTKDNISESEMHSINEQPNPIKNQDDENDQFLHPDDFLNIKDSSSGSDHNIKPSSFFDGENKPSVSFKDESKRITSDDVAAKNDKKVKKSKKKIKKVTYDYFEQDDLVSEDTVENTDLNEMSMNRETDTSTFDEKSEDHAKTDEDFSSAADDVNNLKFWPTYVYWIKPENCIGKRIGCVLKAKSGCIGKKGNIECHALDTARVLPPTDLREDIANSPFEIKATVDDSQLNFENPWKIIIPHVLPKNSQKEPVILTLNDDESEWVELATSEINMDELKEHKLRFVEAKLEKPFGVFIIQTKTKIDTGVINKHGARIASSMDSRVFVSVPADAIRITLNASLKINMVDTNFWKELKSKTDKIPLDQVICSSHLIDFTSKKKKLIKPATINCNLPLSPEVKKQQEDAKISQIVKKKVVNEENDDDSPSNTEKLKPVTAKIELNSFQKSLLVSGIAGDANESLRVMIYNAEEDKWHEMEKPEISTDKTKEQMSLEFPTIQSTKFFMVRANRTITLENLTKAVKIIESELHLRNSLIILLKSSKNPYEFLLLTCLKSRVEKCLSQLKDEGYLIESQNVPVPIELKERQIITAAFSGNIQNVNSGKNMMKFAYQSLFQNIQIFQTKEIDSYAQRAIDHYRGYIVISTKKLMKKPIESADKKARKGNVQYQLIEEDIIVCQLLISIPKKRLVAHKPLRSTKFNREILEDFMAMFTKVAEGIGVSWRELGGNLRISESRLHSLRHQNPGQKFDKIIIEMLIFWLKGLEMMEDKPEILRQALIEMNRNDIAVMMQESADEDGEDSLSISVS